MKENMTQAQAQQLRDDSKNYCPLVRGFHVDEKHGPISIMLDGKETRGDWRYGYLVRQDNHTYIYGGVDLNDAMKGVGIYPSMVDPRTVCRSTGLILRCEKTGIEWPIFEYDVCEAITKVPGLIKDKTFVFHQALVYWHAPTLSWGIIDTETGNSYPINSDWSMYVRGTIFNSEIKLKENMP